MQWLQKEFGHSSDLVVTRYKDAEKELALIYVDTLIDKQKIQHVLPHLNSPQVPLSWPPFSSPSAQACRTYPEAISALLEGYAAIAREGMPELILIQADAAFQRDVKEPEGERVIKGAHEGLVERLAINVHLIRKRVAHPKLMIDHLPIHTENRTTIALLYIDGKADPDVIRQAKDRLKELAGEPLCPLTGWSRRLRNFLTPRFLKSSIRKGPTG
ncbi:spore germination protein [Paenibacillus sp. CC-CFT747]|nr:spore germination protein [Paenibacillus sp. CC-CFT747]